MGSREAAGWEVPGSTGSGAAAHSCPELVSPIKTLLHTSED